MAGRHGRVGNACYDQADAGHVELLGRGAGDRGDVRRRRQRALRGCLQGLAMNEARSAA